MMPTVMFFWIDTVKFWFDKLMNIHSSLVHIKIINVSYVLYANQKENGFQQVNFVTHVPSFIFKVYLLRLFYFFASYLLQLLSHR